VREWSVLENIYAVLAIILLLLVFLALLVAAFLPSERRRVDSGAARFGHQSDGSLA
jgi:cbb3-type cytochrome oxidase subunit 3